MPLPIALSHAGAAVATTTTNSLSSVDTSVTLASVTGWPSTGSFYVALEPGLSGEEKCLATRSGSTLTLTRGQDGTSGVSHASGVAIIHVFTAQDAKNANLVASMLTTKGDLLGASTIDLVRIAVGANDLPLVGDSSATAGVSYKALPSAGVASPTADTKTASYTLVAADRNRKVIMNAAGATAITVNTSLFAAGDEVFIHNIGAGVCTVTAGTATVTSAGVLAIPQWGSGTLYFTSVGAAIYFPTATLRGVISVTEVTGGSGSVAVETLRITSPSFIAVTGRLYRITYYEPALQYASGTITRIEQQIRITNIAGAVQQLANIKIDGAGQGFGHCSVVKTLTAGATVFVGTFNPVGGGNISAFAAASAPGQLIIEDIGPA